MNGALLLWGEFTRACLLVFGGLSIRVGLLIDWLLYFSSLSGPVESIMLFGNWGTVPQVRDQMIAQEY